MILSEKLLTLRTRAGLSQEELAEKLNVSRQSVSKWESGSSIPGIDKILEISRIYGISTDYLLKDEMEELPGEVVADVYRPEEVREIPLETTTEYLSAVRDGAGWIALGVSLCILSPVPMLIFFGMLAFGVGFPTDEVAGGVGVGVLLAIVAAAVILFILNGLRLDEYEYLKKEKFRLSYGVAGIIEKEEKAYRPVFYKGIAFGVALCVISCVPIMIAGAADAADGIILYLCALLLVLVALGVHLIVRVAIRKGGYDCLLQQGDYTEENKQKNKRLEVFDGAYWGIVTAVYLGISFVCMNWHISWVIWPVAAVDFAAIRSVVAAMQRK
ncbi:MAG: helix-turn-helix domain-containing protein [Lachnospiraceae bacterium]|nr:helix-turn-helix domain-containing protein [Lachnospiraceae bacterium]